MFLPILYARRCLLTTCCVMGMKWSLGQLNLVCLVLQYSQGKTSNSSMTFLFLSRRYEQSSQSMGDSSRMAISLSCSRWYRTEQTSDLTSKLGLRLVMKWRLMRKGLSSWETLLTSITLLKCLLSFFLETYPISPALRMNRWQLSSSGWMISSGWQMHISIFSAREYSVFSIKLWKKVNLSKMCLLDSFSTSFLNPLGSFSMKCFSSSRLNFFLMLMDSSMQLLILQLSSSGRLFLRISFLKILKFLLFSMSCARMLLISAPTQLMLQASAKQLTVSMKMRQMASWQVDATMSPNPTVSMMFVPQQYDHTYRSIHGAEQTPFTTIQFIVSFSPAIAARSTARICAKQKLKMKVFTSDQYCSLQQLSIMQIQSFYSLYSIWGNLETEMSRQQRKRVIPVAAERMRARILTASMQRLFLAQCFTISLNVRTFRPDTVFLWTKLMLISNRATAMDTIWTANSPVLSDTSQKTSARVQMKRENITSVMRTSERRWSRASLSSIPSFSRKDCSSQSSPMSNSTGGEQGLFLLSFWMKMSLRMLIFWLVSTSFSYSHFFRFFIISRHFSSVTEFSNRCAFLSDDYFGGVQLRSPLRVGMVGLNWAVDLGERMSS